MKLAWHYLLVGLMAVLLGILYLREPGFGDDLTYWTQAFEMHEQGPASIERSSFHDLRWPVWGVCWVIQAIFGFGASSFYGEPFFYTAVGAILAFGIGRRLLDSTAAGWAGAMAFIFHPLLDSICFRPMPDLSEGVFGAAIVASWWALMQSAKLPAGIGWSVLTGLLVYTAESNRVTGAFIVPVLLVNTLLFFRRRFLWLVGAGIIAAACYFGEMVIYHRMFGDWLHNLHANMGNAGNKGTEPMPLWFFPIRFLDTLWNGNRLAPAYCILAALGIPFAWRKLGVLGRVVVVWFAVLYLEYSCMPQPMLPIRPLIRDADRFLAGLAVPTALLGVAGLWWLWEKARAARFVKLPAPALGAVGLLVLILVTTRERFNPGFVPEFRDYLRALPAGTKVFTHESMRAIAFLCDSTTARQLDFVAPNQILFRQNALEKKAAHCTEFWYARKLVWLGTRKRLEKKDMASQPPLGSYFDDPERDWTLVRLLAKGDTPDLIFYRRRTSESPLATSYGHDAPEFAGLLPSFPVEWNKDDGARETKKKWTVPESFKGKLARVEIAANSPQVEPFTLRMNFKDGKNAEVAEYMLKPYLHAEQGKDFFVFAIPPNSSECDFTLKFSTKAKAARIQDFRVVLSYQ